MGTGGAGQVPDTLVTARPAAGRDSEAAARRTPSRFGIDPDKGVASHPIGPRAVSGGAVTAALTVRDRPG